MVPTFTLLSLCQCGAISQGSASPTFTRQEFAIQFIDLRTESDVFSVVAVVCAVRIVCVRGHRGLVVGVLLPVGPAGGVQGQLLHLLVEGGLPQAVPGVEAAGAVVQARR